MKKADVIISLIIGFLIGIFLFVILTTLQVKIQKTWLILVPFLTIFALFTASFLGRKFLAIYQLAKFIAVGALNTFLDLTILNFLMWFSGIYSGAFFAFFKGISFLVAATNSYFWNKLWTFEQRNEFFSQKEYTKFLLIVGTGLLINVGIAVFVVNFIGPQFGMSEPLWANFGSFLAVFIAATWNFIGLKSIVFKK